MSEEAKVPGFFRRRDLLDSEQTPEGKLVQQGEEFAEQGLLDEALTFFIRAGDEKGMKMVLAESRRLGDSFTFDASLRVLGKTASRDEWKEVGEKAFEAGRLWFSYRAFEKADYQEGLEKVRAAMGEQGVSLPS
jgi:hypothetical protein